MAKKRNRSKRGNSTPPKNNRDGVLRDLERMLSPSFVAHSSKSELDMTERAELHPLYFTAVHESSHAVVAHVVGIDYRSVTINLTKISDGRTLRGALDVVYASAEEMDNNTEEISIPYIIMLMAGPNGEAMARGGVENKIGASKDRSQVQSYSGYLAHRLLGGDLDLDAPKPYQPEDFFKKRNEIIEMCNWITNVILLEHRPSIAEIVASLLSDDSRGTLVKEEVARLIDRTTSVKKSLDFYLTTWRDARAPSMEPPSSSKASDQD